MRKKFYLLIVATCMCLFVVKGQNYASNGDMENWNEVAGVYDPVPVGYVKAVGTNAWTERVDGRGATGNALKMRQPSTDNGQHRRLDFPVTQNLAPGTYVFSAYFKGVGTIRWVKVSKGNAYDGTNGVNYIASTNVAADDWQEISFEIPVTEAGTIFFSMSIFKTTDDTKPFLMDDVTVTVKSGDLSSDATLKSIKFKDPGISTTYPDGDFSMPGVNAATTAYTFPRWFGCDTVPTIIAETNYALATYTVDYGGSKKFSEINDPSVKTKIVTITVEAEDGSTQDYTVTFDRTDFVCGFVTQISTVAGREFSSMSSGIYRRSTTDHGLYWGNATVRPGSSTGGYIITTKLINGAGTLSFWTGKYSGSDAGELNIKVTYTTDGSIWNDVPNGLVRIDSAALNGAWTEISLPILKNNPDTQIKLEYISSSANYSTVNLDDIRITPYAGTSTPKMKPNNSANIYAQGNFIVIAEKMPYKVYTAGGQLIASGTNADDLVRIPVKQGLYIVKAGNSSKKIIVR